MREYVLVSLTGETLEKSSLGFEPTVEVFIS